MSDVIEALADLHIESEALKDRLEQKQVEIDKLKAELSAAKNISVAEFRKPYEEMGPEKAGGAWKTKGNGGGKGSCAKGSKGHGRQKERW